MSDTKYHSPDGLVESGKYPFTKGQLRHYLMHRHKNGLEKAVRKIGKRIVLRIDLFEDWIEKQREGKNG